MTLYVYNVENYVERKEKWLIHLDLTTTELSGIFTGIVIIHSIKVAMECPIVLATHGGDSGK